MAPPPEDAYAYDEPVFSPVPVEAPPRDAPAFSPVDSVAAAPTAVPPTPHNSRTSLAEDFEVQLPEPPVEEKHARGVTVDYVWENQRWIRAWAPCVGLRKAPFDGASRPQLAALTPDISGESYVVADDLPGYMSRVEPL